MMGGAQPRREGQGKMGDDLCCFCCLGLSSATVDERVSVCAQCKCWVNILGVCVRAAADASCASRLRGIRVFQARVCLPFSGHWNRFGRVRFSWET